MWQILGFDQDKSWPKLCQDSLGMSSDKRSAPRGVDDRSPKLPKLAADEASNGRDSKDPPVEMTVSEVQNKHHRILRLQPPHTPQVRRVENGRSKKYYSWWRKQQQNHTELSQSSLKLVGDPTQPEHFTTVCLSDLSFCRYARTCCLAAQVEKLYSSASQSVG